MSINVLLNSLPILSDNFYTLQAIASDGFSRNYSIDEVNGHILVYNATGEEIETENLTRIIAYKENGILLNETTKGPLRIVFIGTRPAITNSAMWLGLLTTIKLN